MNLYYVFSRLYVNLRFPYTKLNSWAFSKLRVFILGFLRKGAKDDIRSTMILISPPYKNMLIIGLITDKCKGKGRIDLKFLSENWRYTFSTEVILSV
jgi:hypothetical protein